MRSNTKDRVREAAVSLFAKNGYEATGIRDIAKEAGISLASLYGHISNKEDLLVWIMEGSLRRLHEGSVEALKGYTEPVDQIAVLVRIHVFSHAKRRQSAVVVDTEIRSLSGDKLKYIVGLRDDYERIWRDVIRQGALDGSFDVKEPKIGSLALLEMCTGVSHWFRSDGEFDLTYVSDVFVDSALGLLRAQRNGKPLRVYEVANVDADNVFATIDSLESSDDRSDDIK